MSEPFSSSSLLLLKLPATSRLLEQPELVDLAAEFGLPLVRSVAAAVLLDLRERIRAGEEICADEMVSERLVPPIMRRVRALASAEARTVWNAGPVLLSASLGRAPLGDDAASMLAAATGYAALPPTGREAAPALREGQAEFLMRELTGCEAATVVNNNAAALLLALKSLSCGREVLLARDQVADFGGRLGVPDLVRESGALLREIGCVNHTTLHDYETACDENTGAVLWLHPLNYRLCGARGGPGVLQLAPLAARRGVPLIADLGAGAMTPLEEWGLPPEPLVREAVQAGAELVCFSGDKLLGGPQCGILCGKREAIDALRRSPLARLLRVDKLTLAALEATLTVWLNGEYRERLPLYRMLCKSRKDLLDAAGLLVESAREFFEVEARIVESSVSLFAAGLPGVPAVAVRMEARSLNPVRLLELLREEGIFGHSVEGAVYLEVLPLLPGQEGLMAGRLQAALERFALEAAAGDGEAFSGAGVEVEVGTGEDNNAPAGGNPGTIPQNLADSANVERK